MFQRQTHQAGKINLGELFAESAAGIQVSGDSGTGKSEFLKQIMRALARAGQGFLLIDPEGDLANDMVTFCADLPPRLRAKVWEIKPADTRRSTSVNPLLVPGARCDLHTYRARRAAKVSHFRNILFSAWGESEQGINGRPQLAKISDLYLNTLAECGLTVPDVECFFDTSSDVYQALTARAPNLISQLELSALADLRPREREELIASTKNRFLGFLQNPIIHTVLGNVDREQILNMTRLVREGAIVIVNLERLGVMRDEDVQILANLFLHELLFAVYNMPQGDRVPYFVILDELPDFESCAPLLVRALRHVRKYRLRFVCAHQGTQFFRDRLEDRLLHALVGQCRAHYYFRHADPVDAKFFGEIVTLPTLDPRRVKHVLRQEQQYQDGHDLVELVDESDNWTDSDTAGTALALAASDTTTDTAGTSQAVRDVLGAASQAARQEVNARTQSTARATGSTRTETENRSHTAARGGSRTRRQTLVPRLKFRTVVTSVQFYPIEEQSIQGAVQLARLPVGTALEYIAGRGMRRLRFPLPKNPLARTPRYARRKRWELERLLAARPEYATPAEVLAARKRFLERLVEHLRTIPVEHRPPHKPRQLTDDSQSSPFGI